MSRAIACPHGIEMVSRCKSCKAAYAREWRLKNPEKARAHLAELHAATLADPVKREASRLRDRISARKRYHANPEPARAYARNRWLTVKSGYDWSRHAIYKARWLKKHPEAKRLKSQKWRARLLAAPGYCTESEALEIFERQNHRCANPYCACVLTPENKHLDHITALAAGGSNYPWNMQWLCRRCNGSKADKPMSVWLEQQAACSR